jgi:glutamyl-tRNA reductase
MTQSRGSRATIRLVVGLVMIGSCQQLVSLQVMQPLHQRQGLIATRLETARRSGRCAGAVMLATCNRFEIVVEPDAASADELRTELFAGFDVPLRELRDADVVRHLIRVAAGLESLVLGEDQIIGQVARTFREAEARGILGKHLHMLYTRVMHAARRVRHYRPVVSAPRSVAGLAARIAREAGPRVLVVGAGTTAHTTAEALRGLGARELHFRNRTAANAARLAHHFGGTAGTLDDLAMSPPNVDAVVVAINGRQLQLPVQQMPSLATVIDISQPTVATGLEASPHIRHLDLDGLARLEQAHSERLVAWQRTAEAAADDDAARIWKELENGRVDLGQLLGRHVENAAAEVDRALRGSLRGLPSQLVDEVRRLAERVARRNAHLHISDAKHFVGS